MPSSGVLELGPAAGELLASLGSPIREAVVITRLDPAASRRMCYRVDLADGRTVKMRRAATEVRARRYARLVTALADARFARVMARRGDVTLEEWVPGTPLESCEARDEHLAAGAALLATVHARETIDGHRLPGLVSTQRALRAMETNLGAVQDAGAVDARLARRIRALAADHAPGAARAGVVHTDLCPENLVVDGGGTLRAVDNEAMRLGFAAFDLARVWYRWPMSARGWRIFVDEYARVVDPEAALTHFTFWKIAAVLHSARVRARRGIAAADVPLRRLQALVDEG